MPHRNQGLSKRPSLHSLNTLLKRCVSQRQLRRLQAFLLVNEGKVKSTIAHSLSTAISPWMHPFSSDQGWDLSILDEWPTGNTGCCRLFHFCHCFKPKQLERIIFVSRGLRSRNPLSGCNISKKSLMMWRTALRPPRSNKAHALDCWDLNCHTGIKVCLNDQAS